MSDIDYSVHIPTEVWQIIIKLCPDALTFIRMSQVCKTFFGIIRSVSMMRYFEEKYEITKRRMEGKLQITDCNKYDIFGNLHGPRISMRAKVVTYNHLTADSVEQDTALCNQHSIHSNYVHGVKHGHEITKGILHMDDGNMEPYVKYYDVYRMGTRVKSVTHLRIKRGSSCTNLFWICAMFNDVEILFPADDSFGHFPWLSSYVELFYEHYPSLPPVPIEEAHKVASDIYAWRGYRFMRYVPIIKVYINRILRSIVHYEECSNYHHPGGQRTIMIIDYFNKEGIHTTRTYTDKSNMMEIKFDDRGRPRMLMTYTTKLHSYRPNDMDKVHREHKLMNGATMIWNEDGVLIDFINMLNGKSTYRESIGEHSTTIEKRTERNRRSRLVIDRTLPRGRDNNDRITGDILHKLIMLHGPCFTANTLREVFDIVG